MSVEQESKIWWEDNTVAYSDGTLPKPQYETDWSVTAKMLNSVSHLVSVFKSTVSSTASGRLGHISSVTILEQGWTKQIDTLVPREWHFCPLIFYYFLDISE